MIEKIRGEIDSYMRENIRIESFSEFCDIAEHFYNLALADVKREIVARKGVNEHLGRKGHIEEDLLILDFIDKQNQ